MKKLNLNKECFHNSLKTKKAPSNDEAFLSLLAVRTRLELATLAVTGRYSTQLNYRTNVLKHYLPLKAGQKYVYFFFQQAKKLKKHQIVG